jgi:hypothetical protein
MSDSDRSRFAVNSAMAARMSIDYSPPEPEPDPG